MTPRSAWGHTLDFVIHIQIYPTQAGGTKSTNIHVYRQGNSTTLIHKQLEKSTNLIYLNSTINSVMKNTIELPVGIIIAFPVGISAKF